MRWLGRSQGWGCCPSAVQQKVAPPLSKVVAAKAGHYATVRLGRCRGEACLPGCRTACLRGMGCRTAYVMVAANAFAIVAAFVSILFYVAHCTDSLLTTLHTTFMGCRYCLCNCNWQVWVPHAKLLIESRTILVHKCTCVIVLHSLV